VRLRAVGIPSVHGGEEVKIPLKEVSECFSMPQIRSAKRLFSGALNRLVFPIDARLLIDRVSGEFERLHWHFCEVRRCSSEEDLVAFTTRPKSEVLNV
jgi:hypothetical protein